MTKGQSSIPMLVGLSAVTLLFLGWNSWGSIKIMVLGEQAAATTEWQTSTTQSLDDYRQSTTQTLSRMSDDITELKIDTATSKELIKLISDRYQINATAVEAQVTREIKKEEMSSTTAQI